MLLITAFFYSFRLLESRKAIRRKKSEMRLKDVSQTKRRDSISIRIRKETVHTKEEASEKKERKR